MELVLPSTQLKDAFLAAVEESKDETSDTKLKGPSASQSFEEFIQDLDNQAKSVNLADGRVPATMFWLVDNNEVIGRIQIRHILSDFLLKQGGHIGYFIRPSKRNMGYGKSILNMGLEEAKKLGLQKVLITCAENNVGSRKIIESNGGVLEDILETTTGKTKACRYWIDLN
jgi:predicted acetyltransferase